VSHRRIVILAEGKFSPLESKTANQAIRYIPDDIVAVIDSTQRGKSAREVLGFGGTIPVVANIRETLPLRPDTLLIGIAPTGGRLPREWRPVILEAMNSKLHVISGLHTVLSDDAEFAAEALRNGVWLVDLRKVSPEYETIARGCWKERKAKTVLTVGTDCNVGKMTAALELHREFQRRTLQSDFVATGQTGILLSGRGIAIDSVVSDFVAGAIEKEVERSASAGNSIIVVEGQGSLTHQGYSSLTLGLLHGVMPDAMILVHHPIRQYDDYGFALNQVGRFIGLYEAVLAPFKDSRVVGIAMNTALMSQRQIDAAQDELESETKLPVGDVLSAEGRRKLADAVIRQFNIDPGV